MTDRRRLHAPFDARLASIPAQRVPADGEPLIDLSAPPPRPAARPGSAFGPRSAARAGSVSGPRSATGRLVPGVGHRLGGFLLSSGVGHRAAAGGLTPAARRPAGVVLAVAVFLAGGVGYAMLRPSPVVAPTPPAATVEASPPPAPAVGRTGIPKAAAEHARKSPAAR